MSFYVDLPLLTLLMLVTTFQFWQSFYYLHIVKKWFYEIFSHLHH